MAGWALAVSIASLVVAIGAVALSWYLWRRSGPEIVVIIHANGLTSGVRRTPVEWRGVEVVNSGRMPAVIREVGVMFESGYIGADVIHKLNGDEPYPITIAPTGYLLVPWSWQGLSANYLASVRRARGYAIRGDGRRFESSYYISTLVE